MAVYPGEGYVSSLKPQPYDAGALAYVNRNAKEIEKVAERLNVSADAIAGSMAREQTRADDDSPVSAELHKLLFAIALLKNEKQYEKEYTDDTQLLKRNPGAFDENPAIQYLEYPTRRDIGPGSIKVFTAFEIIRKYSDTPEGRALGLNRYGPHDLKRIVENLADKNNSLSIVVAGFVIRQGEQFFEDRSIAGIPWSDLSNEQKDAALTAYYSLGEHAVSVEMAKHEFLPFERVFAGKRVGPWILFGENYKNLQIAVDSGLTKKLSGDRARSFAPIMRPGSVPRQTTGAERQASANEINYGNGRSQGSIQVPIFNAQNISVVLGRVSQASNRLLEVVTKAERSNGPHQVSLPMLNAQSLAAAMVAARPSSASIMCQAAKARLTSLSPVSARESHLIAGGKDILSIVVGNDADQPSGVVAPAQILATMLELANDWAALPSVAPRNIPGQRMAASAGYTPVAYAETRSLDRWSDEKATPRTRVAVEEADLVTALNRLFDRQTRMPPSGITGFDTRLSPAWPGLQIENC